MKRKILLVLLTIHSIVSLIVFQQVGVFSVFPPFQELYAWQIFSDLVVSLCLILFFIYHEMKQKRRPMGPLILCAVGMAILGSFSPLIFLLINKDLFGENVLNL